MDTVSRPSSASSSSSILISDIETAAGTLADRSMGSSPPEKGPIITERIMGKNLKRNDIYVPPPPGTFISSTAGMLRSEVRARLVVLAQQKLEQWQRNVYMKMGTVVTNSSLPQSLKDIATETAMTPDELRKATRSRSQNFHKWSYSRQRSYLRLMADREMPWPYAKLGVAELDYFKAGLLSDPESIDWYTSPMEERYPHLQALASKSENVKIPPVDIEDGEANNEDDKALTALLQKMNLEHLAL